MMRLASTDRLLQVDAALIDGAADDDPGGAGRLERPDVVAVQEVYELAILQDVATALGGYTAHLRGIEDDAGRAMVLINWNVDMGDGWEWSNAAEYPGYGRVTAQAYRMQINEIVYSLTH